MSDSHADPNRVPGAPASDRHRFVVDDDDAILRIIEEMAAVLDRRAVDLEPLARDVDPSLVERLLDSGGATSGRVTFDTNGLAVTVHDDGEVVFEPADR